jgi:hypothetical protein
MTLTKQREAGLCDAPFYFDLLPDEVRLVSIELLQGSTLAYRKAMLCAE